MNASILKRIMEMERAVERVEAPSLIMISYNEKSKAWDVQEEYVKRDGKGNIIPGGFRKQIQVKKFEDYDPPRGFMGTLIVDDARDL